MKYYEYDCSWLPQFWGRHGEGYKNASATMRLLETGQPHEMRLWHESIESYVPTLLCSTAEQQRSKKFGNWLASGIQLVLHLRRGKPIGGGQFSNESLARYLPGWGVSGTMAPGVRLPARLTNGFHWWTKSGHPKVQQFVILPLKLSVWGIYPTSANFHWTYWTWLQSHKVIEIIWILHWLQPRFSGKSLAQSPATSNVDSLPSRLGVVGWYAPDPNGWWFHRFTPAKYQPFGVIVGHSMQKKTCDP